MDQLDYALYFAELYAPFLLAVAFIFIIIGWFLFPLLVD